MVGPEAPATPGKSFLRVERVNGTHAAHRRSLPRASRALKAGGSASLREPRERAHASPDLVVVGSVSVIVAVIAGSVSVVGTGLLLASVRGVVTV